MAAKPAPRPGGEAFARPEHVNQRRYEAVRAYLYEGASAAEEAARARVTELRRQGLSVYEISSRLAAEGRPLNRTGVGQILAEEGFGRLLRHPEPEASVSPATAGRDTNLPRAQVIDFAAWPQRLESTRAGLLLVL